MSSRLGMHRRSYGYLSDVTSHLPFLIAIGFAPVGIMILLVIVTRIEGSLPTDRGLSFTRPSSSGSTEPTASPRRRRGRLTRLRG